MPTRNVVLTDSQTDLIDRLIADGYTGRKGKGLFMPLRKALTGQAHGPDMSDVMPLLQVVRARG